MNKNINLPNLNALLYNFQNCLNWEEKYLYIIELGHYLLPIPKNTELKKHLVPGCQSKVWIVVSIKNDKKQSEKKIVQLYGDSDSSITKGILSIIFIIYQKLTIKELIHFNPYPFLNKLKLINHLTYSRSQGIKSILQVIHHQTKMYESDSLK